ncbi:HD-GYP domain-containing protein [Deinococcus multiflagellatus]|uniref:HD-GYP domain-containing protein n=1 Tax=Deinococcus multiflagellatus TaxID=1656887 RepID=A0ABW1ZRU8_9DEIO|nr:HD domain-containing phosphohydrolase [Deinococcus multiflagellatus]MBZ9714397.1 HD domain-containing protein [Deinococcus multiflagellatus]
MTLDARTVLPTALLSALDCLGDDHGWRVAQLCGGVALRLGLDVQVATLAGAVHDVGKLAVPLSVLNKPGPLSPDEQQLMRRHVPEGLAILSALWPAAPATVYQAVAQHHEREGGGGYPNGETRLTALAAVLAAADVYDALQSHRPYRPAHTPAEAYRLTCQEALPQWALAALGEMVGIRVAS